MEPEIQPTQPEAKQDGTAVPVAHALESYLAMSDPWETRAVGWMFLGSKGLRCGWSALGIFGLFYFLREFFGELFFTLHIIGFRTDFSPSTALFGELVSF